MNQKRNIQMTFIRALAVAACLLPELGSPVTAEVPEINRYEIAVPEDVLQDLRQRLQAARWPDQLPETGWAYGADLNTLMPLAEYWAGEFDWRAAELRLNRFDQFITEVDSQAVHFIHEQSAEPDAIPLLLLHGWPGSVAEFTEVIGPLADPAGNGASGQAAFHVIAPSLPGFGFSGVANETGWDTRRMAATFLELMSRLGYERFAVQGGDFGSIIAQQLALQAPERVTALHLNLLVAMPPSLEAMGSLSPDEMEAFTRFQREEMGHFTLQETKPQTIAYALNDSPIGLLAWHAEKFQSWVDHEGSFLDVVSRDAFLTNLTIYWATETSGSSARLYREGLLAGGNFNQPPRFETPIGHAVFPSEVIASPERWNAEAYNVVRRHEMPRGGHFAAMEQPDLLVVDIRTFFAGLVAEEVLQ